MSLSLKQVIELKNINLSLFEGLENRFHYLEELKTLQKMVREYYDKVEQFKAFKQITMSENNINKFRNELKVLAENIILIKNLILEGDRILELFTYYIDDSYFDFVKIKENNEQFLNCKIILKVDVSSPIRILKFQGYDYSNTNYYFLEFKNYLTYFKKSNKEEEEEEEEEEEFYNNLFIHIQCSNKKESINTNVYDILENIDIENIDKKNKMYFYINKNFLEKDFNTFKTKQFDVRNNSGVFNLRIDKDNINNIKNKEKDHTEIFYDFTENLKTDNKDLYNKIKAYIKSFIDPEQKVDAVASQVVYKIHELDMQEAVPISEEQQNSNLKTENLLQKQQDEFMEDSNRNKSIQFEIPTVQTAVFDEKQTNKKETNKKETNKINLINVPILPSNIKKKISPFNLKNFTLFKKKTPQATHLTTAPTAKRVFGGTRKNNKNKKQITKHKKQITKQKNQITKQKNQITKRNKSKRNL